MGEIRIVRIGGKRTVRVGKTSRYPDLGLVDQSIISLLKSLVKDSSNL